MSEPYFGVLEIDFEKLVGHLFLLFLLSLFSL